jgi:plastocyanin
MAGIRYKTGRKTLSLLLMGLAGLLFLVAARRPEADDRQTGGIVGRITYATVPPDESFEPTDAVVYLTGEGLDDAPGVVQAEPRVSLLNQIDYTFVPRVLPVVAGAEVRFHNGDSELHNIHTFDGGRRVNRMFNRSQLPGSTFTRTFQEPDNILVRCDLHSQMIAHILVLPNVFHTMPGDDGSYSVAGVPPGRYEITAWHELFGRVSVTVDVASGEITAVDLTFSDPLE